MSEVNHLQRIRVGSLSGVMAKHIKIPDGYACVVLDEKDELSQFLAGKYKVASLGQRLARPTDKWSVVLYPISRFRIDIPVAHVRAYDGQLYDLTITAQVEVDDLHQLATALSSEVEMLTNLSADLFPIVDPLVNSWVSDDLSSENVRATVSYQVRTALEELLVEYGLRLTGEVRVEFVPSEQTEHMQDKVAEIGADLADTEMQQRMDALTSHAEWLAFVRQVEHDYDLPEDALHDWSTMVQEVPGETPVSSVPEAKNKLLRWIRNHNQLADVAVTARSQRLVEAADPGESLQSPWGTRLSVWLRFKGILLLVTGIVTSLVMLIAGRFETALIVSATVIPVSIILLSLSFWLDIRAGRIDIKQNSSPAVLDRMRRKNQHAIDQLVRQQVGSELDSADKILQDTRKWLYEHDRTAEALELKSTQDMVKTMRTRTLTKAYGNALYESEIKLTKKEFEALLDNDESLLYDTADISELSSQLMQMIVSSDGQDIQPQVDALQKQLSQVELQLHKRSQLVQP